MNIKTYLSLTRPANIITAIADILAGVSIASYLFTIDNINLLSVILLCISTIGLYAGGIVFNDVFDFELDKIERPERALPSEKISVRNAIILGASLLITGVLAGLCNSIASGFIALIIALLALFYDKYGKHLTYFGPINMGLCRGFNLILGMSIIEKSIIEWWWICIIPICYIAAITMISRSEVHGGNKNTLYFAGFLYITVSISQLLVAIKNDNLLVASVFIILHVFLVFSPLIKAIKNPIGSNIGKAVKAGVLSLIVMDAAWAIVFGNITLALLIIVLIPISIKLAKFFAVT